MDPVDPIENDSDQEIEGIGIVDEDEDSKSSTLAFLVGAVMLFAFVVFVAIVAYRITGIGAPSYAGALSTPPPSSTSFFQSV